MKMNLREYHNAEKDLRVTFFHPYNIMMVLLIIGLSVLFLTLTMSYIYSRLRNGLPPILLPSIFWFNTVILLAGSYTMISAKRYYLADKTEKYQAALLYTIVLSAIFMILQGVGWHQLFSNKIYIHSSNASGYLYAISILHLLHVVGGLPFLIGFLVQARKYMKEPVSVLVYFSDPQKRLKLKLLTLYWHFLDILWIYLVIFFAVNYFIK